MPKAKSDYTEEIKLRASKKFINMCNELHSMDRGAFLYKNEIQNRENY